MNLAPNLPHVPAPAHEAQAVGALLRGWRQRRRLSQMAVALDAGVSPRHMSFVETGRSRPSPEVLMALADVLAVPLRERNALLLAAGYAPRFSQRALDAPDMRPVQAALARLLAAHDPYPGFVLDRAWNGVQANTAGAGLMAALLPAALRTPTVNVYRACLHPDGLARVTVNFAQWASDMLGNLRRAVAQSGDDDLAALEREVLAYPNIRALSDDVRQPAGPPPLLLPCVLDLPVAGRLSLFTTVCTLGAPGDVTLSELCAELFYPADEATAERLRAAAASA